MGNPVKIELNDNHHITNYGEIIEFIDTYDPAKDRHAVKELMQDLKDKLNSGSISPDDYRTVKRISNHYHLHVFDLANDDEMTQNKSHEESKAKTLVLNNNKVNPRVNHHISSDIDSTSGLFIPSALLIASVTITGIMYTILAIINVFK